MKKKNEGEGGAERKNLRHKKVINFLKTDTQTHRPSDPQAHRPTVRDTDSGSC